MDSSKRALQTNGKLFSNFELIFKFLAEKTKKIQKRGGNIDQIAMCYIFPFLRFIIVLAIYSLSRSFSIFFFSFSYRRIQKKFPLYRNLS